MSDLPWQCRICGSHWADRHGRDACEAEDIADGRWPDLDSRPT